MRVVVSGAGVIGVATAYFLARVGHEVCVVERAAEAGMETSFANGGQISASHAEPWANPRAPINYLKWFGRADAPVIFHPRLDWEHWRWGLAFLANCTPARTRANLETVLRLALYNRRQLESVQAETGIRFDHHRTGILHLYRNRRSFDGAAERASLFNELGCHCEILDEAGCIAREPALAASAGSLAGGILSPDDASGDAHLFTQGLARISAELGVEFRYGEEIRRIRVAGGRVAAIETASGSITGDAFVVAAGSYTPLLLKPLGVRLPIYPTKGYSVTLPTEGRAGAPTVSLTDDDYKLVYSRLGERLRIAGMAEFGGYDQWLDPARARIILERALALFPDCGDGETAEFWTGLRPLTPDGAPIIGAVGYPNLFVNSGHGTHGWTLCCGSGRLLADLVDGRTPEIDLAGLGPERFV